MEDPGPARSSSIPALETLSRHLSRATGGAVAVIGLAVLCGWAFDVELLKSVSSSFISMKANTALCFVLLGAALVVGHSAHARTRVAQAALGVSVAALAAANLVEYALGVDLGIDCLLFRDPPGTALTIYPGRMALPAALSLVLLGLAVTFATLRRFATAASVMGAVTFALSLVALVGYGLGLSSWFGLGGQTPAALHTAVALALASSSVTLFRTDRGFMALHVRRGPAGVLLRRGVPFALVVPLCLELVVRAGTRLQLYEPAQADAIHIVAVIATLLGLLLLTAAKLQRLDESRGASERRYRALFDNTSAGFAYLRIIFEGGRPNDFVFLDLNAAAERLTGLSREALIGRRLTEATPTFTETREWLARVEEVARTGSPVQLDYFVPPLGRWFSLSVYSPEADHVAVLFTDISDRKQEVVEVERQLEVLRQVGNDVLFMLAVDGSIVQVNDRAAEVYGFSADEFLRMNIRDLRPPETARELGESIQRGLKPQGHRFEAVHCRRDGTRFPVEVSSRPVELGGKRFVLGLVRDLTQEKAGRAAIERQAKLLDNLFDAVVGTDAALAVNAWNRAAGRIFGWSREEAAGRPIAELVPESFRAQMVEMLEVVLHGRSLERELKVRLPDGSDTWLVVSARPMLDASGAIEGTVSAIMDVTARHKAREQLLQAQKMEAVGRLASGIAHDFNNLLVVVLSNATFLLESFPDTDIRRDDAKGILDAGERAKRLVQQLLTFSRKREVLAGPVDVNGLVLGIEALLRRTIGEDIEVSVELDPELWPTCIDPTHFDQVLINLAVNARDAMPGGGHLTIETQNLLCDTPPAGCEGLPPGRYAVIKVGDDGAGIGADLLPRIFEPFFTTKEVGKGTGLGLSTVYGIVAGAGGGVAVSSASGQGTTFCVYLRASDEAPPSDPIPHHVAHAGLRGTILLVEDDDGVRKTTRRMLERNGFGVIDVRGGAQALHRLQEVRVDAVLSDVVMPEVSGDVLAVAVARVQPELPVVLMSGYTDRQLHGPRIGPVLSKPFTETALVARLSEVLEVAARRRATRAEPPGTAAEAGLPAH